MRAAIYARVSTTKQDTANQLPALHAMANARGFEDVEVITETASGAKARPALDALCERARRGELQAILIWAVDRLGRTNVEINARVQELDRVGCAVVSHQESWLDTSGPTRGLLLGIFTWMAEQERARTMERTTAAVARRRAAGLPVGRPRVDETVQASCARRRAAGQSISKISSELAIARSTVRRYLAPSAPRSIAPTSCERRIEIIGPA